MISFFVLFFLLNLYFIALNTCLARFHQNRMNINNPYHPKKTDEITEDLLESVNVDVNNDDNQYIDICDNYTEVDQKLFDDWKNSIVKVNEEIEEKIIKIESQEIEKIESPKAKEINLSEETKNTFKKYKCIVVNLDGLIDIETNSINSKQFRKTLIFLDLFCNENDIKLCIIHRMHPDVFLQNVKKDLKYFKMENYYSSYNYIKRSFRKIKKLLADEYQEEPKEIPLKLFLKHIRLENNLKYSDFGYSGLNFIPNNNNIKLI